MSNPAVITLEDASNAKGKIKRFVLEDNIGESLHLHIDNMRVDFTVNEFLAFTKMIRSSLEELDFLSPYTIDNFDEHFLKECADLLPNLERIEIEEVELSKLKCVQNKVFHYDLKLSKLSKIKDVPAYKYLHGEKEEFIAYKQHNYFNTDNEKRLLTMQESIKSNGYPFNNEYIVLFNGQDIIRDGQHRAAILADQFGLDYKVKAMRFHFTGNKHLLHLSKQNLKTSFMWFARKVYRKLKGYIRK